MVEESDDLPKDERVRLAALCRDKKRRESAFSSKRPTEWQPAQVFKDNGDSHTDKEAWECLACLLEAGHAVTKVTLNKPKGGSGWELIVEPAAGSKASRIYIKFEITHPGIYGRSFHIPKH